MKNKIKKTFKEKLSSVKGWFFKRGLTIACCTLIVSLGTVFLVWSSPGATTIGENISTGNITASGNLEVSGNATTTGNFTVSGTTTLATTTISCLAGDIDLNQYQLKEAVLERLSNFPSNATTGQMFWSTATDTPYWYTGSRWKGDVSGATFVVAASDSLNKEKADYVCDGTDDQVEIQAVIDALPAGGGRVLLLEGTFEISNYIDLAGLNNVTLEGQGCGTIIHNNNIVGHNAIQAINDNTITPSSVRYLTVKNLMVKGNASSGDGLHFEYCDVFTIDNVTSNENGGNGFYFNGNSWTLGGESAYGNFTMSGSKFLTNEKAGIHITATHDILISNIHSEENKEVGLLVDGPSFNIVITHCNIEDNLMEQIKINAQEACQISDNTLEGFVSSNYDALYIAHMGYGTVISNNTILRGRRGIFVETTSNIISIVGNCIQDQSYAAISVGSSCYDVVISGNAIGPSTSAVSRGIYTHALNVVISDNAITSDGAGIFLISSESFIVANNSVRAKNIGAGEGESQGIVIKTCSKGQIVNNNIEKGDDTNLTEGILFIGSCSECTVRGNYIRNSDTPISGLTSDMIAHRQHSDPFQDLQAASTTYIHAAITGTGAEQEITTAITNPDVPRNISITNSANSTGVVTITGVDAKGNSITDDITLVAGGTACGDKAFATVSKITVPATVAGADTVTVGISDKLGLSNIVYETGDVYKVKKNNADATIGTVDITNGTVDCATITGGDDITIYYRSNLNIIE
jgi:hypothetical protein